MGVRDTKIRDRVAVGAPETGHQPAFDDGWSPIDIPDIINGRRDPSARERRYRTRYATPEQRKNKRRGPRQKNEFNSRHRRIVTKADNNYSNSQPGLKFTKRPPPKKTDWGTFVGFFIFTLHGWLALFMGICWLVQYIF